MKNGDEVKLLRDLRSMLPGFEVKMNRMADLPGFLYEMADGKSDFYNQLAVADDIGKAEVDEIMPKFIERVKSASSTDQYVKLWMEGDLIIDREKLATALFGGENPPIPTAREIAKALDGLDDRGRFVIVHRFTRPFKTMREIAVIYPRADGGVGVSHERVSMKMAAAIRKLRRRVSLGILLER